MANLVIASNSKAMSKLDGSVKKKVYDFFEKLNTDDTARPAHRTATRGDDPRVRTGRVDLHYRAILFRVDDKSSGPTYIYMGTWPHDEANKLAEQATLRVNPINGTLEGLIGEVPAPISRRSRLFPNTFRLLMCRISPEWATSGGSHRRARHRPGDRRKGDAAPDGRLCSNRRGRAGQGGRALLDLATGIAIETIREKHGFTEKPIDTTVDEDEQIIEALDRPASKMQFAFIEDNEELRRVIEGGDFAAWRNALHPEQRKYVESNYSGAFRLSGGAGTGKTVVAIHGRVD